MPRKFLKKVMPDLKVIREHKHLQVFGDLLHEPNLWHMNRRSVAGAFAVGLFNALMPVPFQMILAAGAAILFRVNLPLSVALVWITNPFTMAPMFYGTYQLGAWILNTPEQEFDFDSSIDWLVNGLGAIWEPFLLGCLVAATVSSAAGYTIIRLLWRWHLIQHIKERAKRSHNQPKN